jgi:HD-GYP domain-containing protein (c-di-GMP phosphodiesterase class II)
MARRLLKQRLRAPLHVHVALLFFVLVFLVGGTLATLNYVQTSQILLTAADEWVTLTTDQVQKQLDQGQQSLGASIKLISQSPLLEADSWTPRQHYLHWLRQALDNHPVITTIQVAFANGDWLAMRPLPTPELKSRFHSPEGAILLVDDLSTTNGQRAGTRRFYNNRLALLETEPLVLSEYDPRTRAWYSLAQSSTDVIATEPYVFYFDNTTGMTFARGTNEGNVLAADIALTSLSELLASLSLPPGSDVALVNGANQVIAYTDKYQSAAKLIGGEFRQPDLSALKLPIWGKIASSSLGARSQLEWQGETWRYQRQPVRYGNQTFYLLSLLPESELLKEAKQIRSNNLALTLLTVILAVPLAWFLSRLVSKPLRQLVSDTSMIRRFDFSAKIQTRSFVKEIDELGLSTGMMQEALRHFLKMINSLAGEKHFHTLVQKLTEETRAIAHANHSVLFLYDEGCQKLVPEACSSTDGGTMHYSATPLDATQDRISNLLSRGESLTVTASTTDKGALAIASSLGLTLANQNVLTLIPLRNREQLPHGLLVLLEDAGPAARHDATEFEQNDAASRLGFVMAITGFAAVSLETQKLLKRQKQLLASFIELIAGAIDSKSPYTGGHCQRVPALTKMLTQAACDCNHGPFATFNLDPDQWEAVHIASWLHDCGKVTTPEYVVDKATKLETIHDRIHEVRMRFEVLKLQHEKNINRQVFGDLPAEHDARLQVILRRLDEEFAFVARCNIGGEFLSQQDISRLREIGRQTWMRTLDNTLGTGHEEKKRVLKDRTALSEALPVEEPLLADKGYHLFPRDSASIINDDNQWGFKLSTPDNLFNKGELHNLSVSRGTLTPEERFLINDHIVQTIIMLNHLPYPDHLKNVPEIAGGHHEHMDGTGYPRCLRREDMPITARVMAIADIYEALTASDRPYKTAMPLSQVLNIMTKMALQNQIDADLYSLFLQSGVYQEYADRYLSPEQCDCLDIQPFLDKFEGVNSLPCESNV